MTHTPEPTFESLLEAMSNLTWIPLDAKERFEEMLQQNFTGSINDDIIAEGDIVDDDFDDDDFI